MLELNRVYNGDSELVLKDVDSESIDLIVTSPPYDNLRKYNDIDIYKVGRTKVMLYLTHLPVVELHCLPQWIWIEISLVLK